jgi:hypothetical protein
MNCVFPSPSPPVGEGRDDCSKITLVTGQSLDKENDGRQLPFLSTDFGRITSHDESSGQSLAVVVCFKKMSVLRKSPVRGRSILFFV